MSSVLTSDGWVVEPDIVDERKGLPRLSGAQIIAINARIAAGSNEFPVGTRVIRVDDSLILALEGTGVAARFRSPESDIAGAVQKADLASITGGDGVGTANPRSGAILRSVREEINDNAVSPDGFAGNDLQKIQQAVDTASAGARAIRLSRSYNITGLGSIDLKSLRATGDLRMFYVLGVGGGIKKDDAGYIFTSTETGINPRYHNVATVNVRFEGVAGSGMTVFNGNKLVGVWSIQDGYWNVDRCIEGEERYIQSFRMLMPDIQRGAGCFISARYYFDVDIQSPRFENRPGQFIRTVENSFNQFTYDANNLRVKNGCFEALTGDLPVFQLGACYSGNFDGNYFEANEGAPYNFAVNTRAIAHSSLKVSGTTADMTAAQIAASTPVITWGKFNEDVISSNNATTGSLMHDASVAGLGRILSTGDTVHSGVLIATGQRSRIGFVSELFGPMLTTWVPTIVWSGGTPTGLVLKTKYKRVGRIVQFSIYATYTDGGGATRATFTLPEAALNDTLMQAFSAVRDVAGVFAPVPAYFISSGGTITVRLENAVLTAAQAGTLAVSGHYEAA